MNQLFATATYDGEIRLVDSLSSVDYYETFLCTMSHFKSNYFLGLLPPKTEVVCKDGTYQTPDI